MTTEKAIAFVVFTVVVVFFFGPALIRQYYDRKQ